MEAKPMTTPTAADRAMAMTILKRITKPLTGIELNEFPIPYQESAHDAIAELIAAQTKENFPEKAMCKAIDIIRTPQQIEAGAPFVCLDEMALARILEAHGEEQNQALMAKTEQSRKLLGYEDGDLENNIKRYITYSEKTIEGLRAGGKKVTDYAEKLTDENQWLMDALGRYVRLEEIMGSHAGIHEDCACCHDYRFAKQALGRGEGV